MKTYKLKVKNKINISDNISEFSLEVPSDLKSIFKYTCGQYVTAILNIDGHKTGRGYSIASCSYTDEDLRFVVKKVNPGKTSPYVVDKVQEGDLLEVTTPQGDFFDVSDSQKPHHYILLGAGSGITPLFSILKTVLLENKENKVTLLYGSRSEDEIIFKDDLDSLEKKYEERLSVTHFLSQPSHKWTGKSGRISDEVLRESIEDLKIHKLDLSFYICGPESMMKSSREAILKTGIAEKSVHIEWYHSPHDSEEDSDEGVFIGEGNRKESCETLQVSLEGENFEVNAEKDLSILETLLNQDKDPPFSCMAGACLSCMAFLEEGLVRQADQGVLTDSDIAQKQILTCQAVAVSKKVKIRYPD